MKRLLLVFAFMVSAFCAGAVDISTLQSAFKTGNAASLAGSVDSEVELSVPGINKKCTGEETVNALNTFFSANKPTSFQVLHQADKADGGFLVGTLPTANGKYRVNITYTTTNNKAVIKSVRIEK